MGRAQEGTTFNTGKAENAEYNQEAQNNYQTAEASNVAAQNDISNYASAVGEFKASNPYGQGGAVQTAQNQQASDTAAGQAEAAGQAMQSAAVRTGQNAGGAIAATENMQNQNERSLASQEAANTVSRAVGDTSYKEAGLSGVGDIETKQAGLGSSEASLAQGQAGIAEGDLGIMQKAGETPTEMETLQADASSALNAYLSGCPAEGSLFLMANGRSDRTVETLNVGERIRGIDGEPETITRIESVIVSILRVETGNGHVGRNSRDHAYALPFGGFTEASHALGKIVLTVGQSSSRIVSVQPAGKARVFNVITNGSHTYCADGIWALGVGEAERHVDDTDEVEYGELLAEVS
jgi:hypothetical protein